MIIQHRKQVEVNTDPQRRCYNGCHFSSEMQWTAWGDLCDATPENVERRLKYWRELNDYSVSVGGTRSEYRVQP